MRLLIDTNVLSEASKPAPEMRVLEWLHHLDEDRTFISAVSIAEIRRGIALMEPGRRRDALASWLSDDLQQRFDQRVIPVDAAVAVAWGDLMASAKRMGRGLASMDGLIGATAITNDLILATRNTKDFQGLGIELFDPWLA
ncbi:MAG: type II toxin-antitoxin system VapC family toxin [Rhizobiaceae bacterium]